MSTENAKTTTFIVVAAVLCAGAWFSIPGKPHESQQQQIAGGKLFPTFTQPGAVDSLKILQFDQKGSKPIALEVAKIDNLWVIPTHGKYPADAKDHLAAAANSLIDLKILGLAPGFDPGSPPMSEEGSARRTMNLASSIPIRTPSKFTDTGIGTEITMKDAAGHEVASAIIGKPVPDQSEDQATKQCYVRETGKEPVYIVQLDPSNISVKFGDWIEKNLLNINTMDLKQVHINDYSIETVVDKATNRAYKMPVPHGEYRVDVASGDQPWKLVEDIGFDEKLDKVPRKMAADEELNTQSLDAMKSALDDLKIVDVERKPAQVPADLRVRNIDEATADTLMQTLVQRGFVPVPVDPKKPDVLDIVSKFGEINLQMNDGARYILRFGNTTGASSTGDAKDKKAEGADNSAGGMDRYLFVMADFNQDAIPKPAMEQLPPEEKPAPKADQKKAGPPAAAPPKTDAKPDAAKKADAAKDPNANKAPNAAKDAAKKDQPSKSAADELAEKAEKAKLRKSEEERIAKENKRRQEEYNDKVTAGKKHVAELQQALRPVVLRHFRRRLPEDPLGPQGDRQEERAAQGRPRPCARRSAKPGITRRTGGRR